MFLLREPVPPAGKWHRLTPGQANPARPTGDTPVREGSLQPAADLPQRTCTSFYKAFRDRNLGLRERVSRRREWKRRPSSGCERARGRGSPRGFPPRKSLQAKRKGKKQRVGSGARCLLEVLASPLRAAALRRMPGSK